MCSPTLFQCDIFSGHAHKQLSCTKPLPQGISVQLGICMHLPHAHVHIAYRLLCGGKMQSDRLLRFTKRSVRCCVAKCCLIYCQPYNNILVEPEAESTELISSGGTWQWAKGAASNVPSVGLTFHLTCDHQSNHQTLPVCIASFSLYVIPFPFSCSLVMQSYFAYTFTFQHGHVETAQVPPGCTHAPSVNTTTCMSCLYAHATRLPTLVKV